MRLPNCFWYIRPVLVGLILWALSQGGCEKPNPQYCPWEDVCVLPRCMELCPFDAAPPIDAGIDGLIIDATSPQAAQNLEVGWRATPQDNGVMVDCPKVATVKVDHADLCVLTALQRPGWSMVVDFDVEVGEMQEVSYLPIAGLNDVRVTCQGAPGTDPVSGSLPQLIPDVTFTVAGAEDLGHCLYRLPTRQTTVTLDWDETSEPSGVNCSASSSPAGVSNFEGTFECRMGSLRQWRPVMSNTGPAVTLSLSIGGPTATPTAHRGIVWIEVPASQ